MRRVNGAIKVDVVDFFSGCGGMSHGFHHAQTRNVHYTLRGAMDLDHYANLSFERNLGVKPIEADVRDVASPSDLRGLRDRWKIGTRPLVVIGCAPCQGFSSHRKKDPRADHRNHLLSYFADIVLGLMPTVVVMENVPEIFRENHWHHYLDLRTRLENQGYKVRAQIHNLAQFGVPQERFRALVVAARDWSLVPMPTPTHVPSTYRTVRDAISDLTPLAPGGADPDDPMHMTSKHRARTIELIKKIPPDGGSRRSLPPGMGPDCLQKVDGFRDVYGRLAWDKPSVAITARCRTPSCGRFTHPEQDRGLSVREAALLQGFPKDFYFEGPFDDKFKQIGNAVSPLFSKALAEHLDSVWGGIEVDDASLDEASDIRVPFKQSFSSRIANLKRQARAAESSVQEIFVGASS